MSIGMFSFRSGLSIPALRHYDEVGLLAPAFVDPQLASRMRTLTRMTATLEEYLEMVSPMPEPTGNRPVQITIHALP